MIFSQMDENSPEEASPLQEGALDLHQTVRCMCETSEVFI